MEYKCDRIELSTDFLISNYIPDMNNILHDLFTQIDVV